MAAKDQIKIENLPSRSGFRRRRKVCPFSGDNGIKIDYKDPKMLQRYICLLYTSPSPRDQRGSRMPSSA